MAKKDDQPQEYWDRQGKVYIGNDQAAREFAKDRLVQRVRKIEAEAAKNAEEASKPSKSDRTKKDADLDRHLRTRSPGNMR